MKPCLILLPYKKAKKHQQPASNYPTNFQWHPSQGNVVLFFHTQFQSVSSKWAFIQRAVLFVVWVQKGLLFITLPYICTNTTPRCSAGFWRWFILTVRCMCSSCNFLGLTWVQPQLCLCSSISWLLSLQLKLSLNLWDMFLQPSPEPQYWQSLFSDLLRITLRIQFCQCSVSKRSTTWKFPP